MTERTVTVVEYDRNWPDLFHREMERIGNTLQQPVVSIEHVGSTAVPGLSARPIIDIAVLLPSENGSGTYEADLTSGKYKRRTDPKHPPAASFLEHDRDENPSIHIFLCDNRDDGVFQRLVQFRELLRTDRELARRYDTLKQGLARRFHDDPDAYNSEKSTFIHTLEEVYL